MIGMVLAAGAGRRLRPYTDTLPKALVPVDGDTTILDIALHNLAAVELRDVVVVVGYAADAVQARRAALERRHGVSLTLVHNDKAEVWNNAYSMWTAREQMADGVLMVNGDTVHPVSVEETLLAARGPEVLLALDTEKPLAHEEMKVQVGPTGFVTRINKAIDPALAYGEYIGASLIEGSVIPTSRRRAAGHLRARPAPLLRGRLPGAGRPGRADRHGQHPHRDVLGRGRRPRRPEAGPGDRVPLLARMLASPLFVDIRSGAVENLSALLHERYISTTGSVARGRGRLPGPGHLAPDRAHPPRR